MTKATVLIPIHQHAEPLRLAIAGVLNQSLEDFEVLLVGDGVTDATRAVVEELLPTDKRIRFLDFPKGPRKGEVHWHKALQEARGRIVAYLGSDDCWMPNHLEVLDELLTDAEFGHTMHIGVDPEGQITPLAADLENPALRDRMVTELFNCFDFSFGGHTLAAYHRLPDGWRTMPPDFPYADLFLWRQFLAEPWCRSRSAMVPTGIHTATHRRPDLSDAERAEDLSHWCRQLDDPAFREKLWPTIAQTFASRSVAYELDARSQRRAAEEHLSQLEEARSKIWNLQCEHAALTIDLTEMRRSTSWKVTSPLRQVRRIVAKLIG